MYPTSKHLFALLATLALASCDKGSDSGAPPAPKKAKITAVRSAAAQPATARGEVDGVLWKHEFDANDITGLVSCGERIYASTRAGRVVRWNPDAMTIEEIPEAFGGVTAIDAAPDGLLVGSSLGRLSMATCDLATIEVGPPKLLPVRFTALDPRSKTRALTIFRETKGDKTHAVGSLVDLRTGKAVHDPFKTPQPANVSVLGFVDYKGELWVGMSARNEGSKLWYLERFDVRQQGVLDLGEDFEMLGLQHVGREVWAYGARDDRSSGFIARVDSGRSQVKWDGEQAWFGAPPGGEVPSRRPITYLLQSGESLLIFVPDGIYRADLEMRRWKRLVGPDTTTSNPFRRVGGHTQHGDTILVGSSSGLVKIKGDSWDLSTVPTAAPAPPSDEPPLSARWGARNYEIVDGELRITQGSSAVKPPRNITKPVALAVDPLERLWIVSPDQIHVLTDANSKPTSIDAKSVGVDVNLIRGTTPSAEDAVGFQLEDGSSIHFRLPKP